MALRYAFPEFAEFQPQTNLKMPALARPPVTVEFRRGVDMRELATEVMQHQSVFLDAAVGAGKSSLFPSAMAEVTKSVVIHVAPSDKLIHDVFNYVNKQREESGLLGVPLETMAHPSQELQRTGVVYASASFLVAWWLKRKRFPESLEVTVVFDEAHESDKCTYLIKMLAIELGASRLVRMSATLSPAGSRARETPGQMIAATYDSRLSPRDWQIDESDKPWYYANITNNLVVFIDSRSQADRLGNLYRAVGMLVFRLESRTSVEDFNVAMIALRDKKGPLVVLLVDYSYRSGFTFDADLIIDTGVVGFYDPTPGAVRKLYRPMYMCESVQAAGRGARIRAGQCQYYYPDIPLEAKICDLEGVEREAAAYLSRCLGFVPVGPLADCILATYNLPASISPLVAFNGVYPLTYYLVDAKGQIRPSTPKQFEHIDIPVSSAASSESTDVGSVCESAAAALLDDDAMRLLAQAFELTGEDWDVGFYYSVAGVTGVDLNTGVSFPRGLRSVLEMFPDKSRIRGKARLMRKDMRQAAVKLVLNRYNCLNVEISAFVAAINSVGKAYSGKRFTVGVKTHIAEYVEHVNAYELERAELLALLVSLVSDDMAMKVVSAPDRLILQRTQLYESDLHKVLSCEFVEDLDVELESQGLVSGATFVSATSLNDRASIASTGATHREGENVLTISVPAWTGYKKIQVSKETIKDVNGHVMDEWRRVRLKRSSWHRRLVGPGSDIRDYG